VPLTAFSPDQLHQFTREFEDLFYAGAPASMTSYYSENAKLMGEGMQPIEGHSAIMEFWHTAITRAVAAGAKRTIQLHESHFSGDLGYALCTVTVRIPPPSGTTGAGTSIAVWDATIWQHDPDGNWRIAVDISTTLPPATS